MKWKAIVTAILMLAPLGVGVEAQQTAQTAQVCEVVYYRRHPRRRVIVRRRPFSHSAAIVGGSAAGGAAIGALAGGGKGALVGGLVGGAGGLIYDRATHKKKRVLRVRLGMGQAFRLPHQ